MAFIYFRLHPDDGWLFTAALPAFMVEGLCFIGAGFAWSRERFRRLPGRSLLLWASALVPYLIFAGMARTFSPRAFGLLAVLTAILSFWHTLFPRRLVYDFGFLVVAAAPIIARVFRRIYISPDPRVDVDILGHLMWLRVGIIAILVLRDWDPGTFGLWPDRKEWRAGSLYFALGIVPLCLLAVGVGDVQFAPLQRSPLIWIATGVGTFFGILWVVALGEELLFRGVIGRAVLLATSSPVLAVIVSSVLFGSAHLWFHVYPNWRRALVATVLGLVCGTLYVRTGSVRAPMVTHSLVVVTWRLLFTR